ncbi:hypothetical protein FNAPI_4439 [Fusarium napiforme]|uniref:Uncharacterized protein n=1 Tax=Fusarium napiforme TaxID=42672 RepID=A0A8H5JQV5_9HYPO|nr:hypothetical protein FNAPI_4439 [Fusarium napiforme]
MPPKMPRLDDLLALLEVQSLKRKIVFRHYPLLLPISSSSLPPPPRPSALVIATLSSFFGHPAPILFHLPPLLARRACGAHYSTLSLTAAAEGASSDPWTSARPVPSPSTDVDFDLLSAPPEGSRVLVNSMTPQSATSRTTRNVTHRHNSLLYFTSPALEVAPSTASPLLWWCCLCDLSLSAHQLVLL